MLDLSSGQGLLTNAKFLQPFAIAKYISLCRQLLLKVKTKGKKKRIYSFTVDESLTFKCPHFYGIHDILSDAHPMGRSNVL